MSCPENKHLAEIQVLKSVISVLSTNIDEFISCCVDEKGNPKAPSKQEVISVRKLLPAQYKNSLIKPKP